MRLREVTVKHALNKTGGFLAGFTHTLNPYGGCQFGADLPAGATGERQGCPYCYVRQMPVALFRSEPWGAWVDVKMNLIECLVADLAALARHDRLGETKIFCASATDPYQPIAETRYQLTRQALAACRDRPPGGLLVQTRSTLVRRDLDRLQELHRLTNLVVSITLETDRDDVRQQITPTSPPVAARFRLLGDLKAAGLFVQAVVSPLLPCRPESFADCLDPLVDRVVLDTFQLGDGSGGRRTERLGMGARLARLGYADWYRPDAYRPVLAAFQRRLGSERVLLSAAGFNSFPSPSADAFAAPPPLGPTSGAV